MVVTPFLSVALLCSAAYAFSPYTHDVSFHRRATFLHSDSSKSRLQGNQRLPTPTDIQTMDEMIDRLIDVPAYELPAAVSRAVRVVGSPLFFVRIAERSDEVKDSATKAKFSALADNIVRTLEVVVSTTEEKLDSNSADVEKIIKAAADEETGEFFVPLNFDQIQKMSAAIREIDPYNLDEGFLTTVDSYMDKSRKDGLDGMVVILQKVLQLYAGEMIIKGRAENLGARVGATVSGLDPDDVVEEQQSTSSPSSDLLDKILKSDVELWDGLLDSSIGRKDSDVSKPQLLGEVQRTMEAVVLGLENGSMAQRVQAEFMRELLMRIENIGI